MGPLKKNLLILSGGIEAIEGIKIAKKMGLKTIVCDMNKEAPGKYFADEFLVGDIYNTREIKKLISEYSKKNSIDGVITIASDAVRSVSTIAKLLKIPGNSIKTSILSTDKIKMKKVFQKNALPIPKFIEINSIDELKKNINQLGDGVLKPIDSRGSRGVIRINKKSDLEHALKYSRKFSSSKKLILEEWINGPQISTESVVISGKTFLCGIADRNYSNSKKTYPFIVEDGGETPSKFYPKIRMKIQEIMDRSAKALEIENGVIKGDIVMKNGQPYIIEIATRLSGGFFSTITIPLVYKINLVEKAILLSLGIKPTPPPKILKPFCYQANRFIFPNMGKIQKVVSPNSKQLPKYVKDFKINAKVGDAVENIQNHTMRKGSILVIGNSRKQAINRVERIRNMVKIKIE